MKRLVCLLSIITSLNNVNAQNLVNNSGFETFTSCPTGITQINLATGWWRLGGHGGNPDYFNVCATVPNIDIPSNSFGNQPPFAGNAYAGFLLFYGALANYREYLETQLTSPMIAGQTYNIELKVSLADNSLFSSPSFQFYFTPAVYVCSPFTSSAITAISGIAASSTTNANSKTTWQTVTTSYTALGGEQYMTMGNFRNDASTLRDSIAGTWLYNSAYYYIDEVSVAPIIPLPVELLEFNVLCKENGTEIDWTTASETNNAYFTLEASEDGITYEYITRIDGSGSSNEITQYHYTDKIRNMKGVYYRLSQTDFDGASTEFSPKYADCDKLMLETCSNIKTNSESIMIELLAVESEIIDIVLFNQQGVEVNNTKYILEQGANSVSINVESLVNGVYYINIVGSDRNCVQKALINH